MAPVSSARKLPTFIFDFRTPTAVPSLYYGPRGEAQLAAETSPENDSSTVTNYRGHFQRSQTKLLDIAIKDGLNRLLRFFSGICYRELSKDGPSKRKLMNLLSSQIWHKLS